MKAFPRLRRHTFHLTSPPDAAYNCIAWAAGDTGRFWWPGQSPYVYWPPGVQRREELAAFVEMFRSLGYEVCDDDALERGYEKLAIFADSNGKPTHASRQLESGRWTSKMGRSEDIEHTVFGLEAGDYGSVVKYLKRSGKRTQGVASA